MNARVEGGAAHRKEHLLAYGEGGDVGGSDGRETMCWWAQVGCRLVEEGNQ